ncbi:hypothetical protein CUT44_28135 [Streptomyces carminius]|uniref:Toxin n=2 Tax=Streptomyces carminius TaxID=2665496 RepID=A0A2M8LRQ2_9ACTN|nr:hypothetical protein CUT44_28135 [Streptomyces carminius]
MRRGCAALVRDLDLPVPAEPDQVIAALCGRMRQRLGREVHHRLVPFPPDTVSGLWVATDSAHYVLCEERTSPWHQLLITCHEFWHMEADHAGLADHAGRAGPGAAPADGGVPVLPLPSLDGATVARIVAGRTHCDAAAEQEADFFAALLMARISRWLPERTWDVPASDAALVHRLESTFGGGPGPRGPEASGPGSR